MRKAVGVRYRYLIWKLFKFDRCHRQSDTHLVVPQLSLGIAPSNSFLASHSNISSHSTFFFSPAVALFVRGFLFVRIPAQNVIKEHPSHERRQWIQRCTLLSTIKSQRLLSSKRLVGKQPSKWKPILLHYLKPVGGRFILRLWCTARHQTSFEENLKYSVANQCAHDPVGVGVLQFSFGELKLFVLMVCLFVPAEFPPLQMRAFE